MRLLGLNRREYTISEAQLIGKGREGKVYRVQLSREEAAAIKMYSEELLSDPDFSKRLEEKLKIMISKPIAEKNGVFSIAWPKDIVYKEDAGIRTFAGYVQCIVDGNCTLSNIIRNKFPKECGDADGKKKSLSWNQAVKAAYNLAYFVAYLHSEGIILGDFNENNFIFNDRTGGYGLIDCGNYGLVNETKTTILFPSNFIMPNYRTPESILGFIPKDPFSSDYFFLAVHIFNILSVNANPFRSISKDLEGNNDFSIEDAIVNGECLYVRQVDGKKLPVDAPSPDYFPADVLDGFKHTFQYSKSTIQESISRRTTAEQWCRILRPYVEKKKSFAQYDSRVGIKKAPMPPSQKPPKEEYAKQIAERVVARLVGSYIQGDTSADYYFNRLYPERDAVLTQQGIKRIEDYFSLDDLNAPYNTTLKRSILTAINKKEKSRIVLERKQTHSPVSPAPSRNAEPTQKKASADHSVWLQQWREAETHNKMIIIAVTVLLLILAFSLFRMVINAASTSDAQNYSAANTVLESSDLLENEQTQISTDYNGSWSSSDNSQTRPHYYCYDDTYSVSLSADGVVNFGPGVWVDPNEPVDYNSYVYQIFRDRLEHDPAMAAAVFAYADKQLGTRYTGSFYSEIKDDWITGINNAAETFVNDMNLWAGETNAFEELLESTADISIINAGGEEIQTLRMRLGDGQPLVYGPETLKTTAPWKYLCFTVHVKTTEITLSFLIDLGFQPVI